MSSDGRRGILGSQRKNVSSCIATYSDIDLKALKGREGYAHADGKPYAGSKPRNPATEK